MSNLPMEFLQNFPLYVLFYTVEQSIKTLFEELISSRALRELLILLPSLLTIKGEGSLDCSKAFHAGLLSLPLTGMEAGEVRVPTT
jgi:hypothetical protein